MSAQFWMGLAIGSILPWIIIAITLPRKNAKKRRDDLAALAMLGKVISEGGRDMPSNYYWDWLSGFKTSSYRIADQMLAPDRKEEA